MFLVEKKNLASYLLEQRIFLFDRLFFLKMEREKVFLFEKSP